MTDPGRVPGAARDAEFRNSAPHAMALEGSLARIEWKRPHSNALKLSAASDMSA